MILGNQEYEEYRTVFIEKYASRTENEPRHKSFIYQSKNLSSILAKQYTIVHFFLIYVLMWNCYKYVLRSDLITQNTL